MTLHRARLPVLAVLLLVAVPVSASAINAPTGVVLDKSVAGVRLGMTKRAVRTTLGKPDKVERSTTPDNKSFVAYDYRSHHIRVLFFAKPTVVEVITTSPKERLSSGVGVGTTESRLLGAIPHLRRQTFDGLSYLHRPHGTKGNFTLFGIRHGRVVQIDVGAE